jgi:hypothetical protein
VRQLGQGWPAQKWKKGGERRGWLGQAQLQARFSPARVGPCKNGKREGKGEAGRARLSFKLGFGPLPNRN